MSNATNANVLLIGTGGGSVIATVNEYAPIISITIALTGLLIALFFHILAVVDRRRIERTNTEKLIEQGRQEAYEKMLNVDENVKNAMSEKTSG
jgi:membrane protein implicated in regulation of membrane protease activity